MLIPTVGDFASAVALTALGLLALWLVADTRRAISSLVSFVGAFYFWLPGRRVLLARALERNLQFARLWRFMGFLIIVGYIVTLAAHVSLPRGLRLPH